MRTAIRSAAELRRYLRLADSAGPTAERDFPTFVTLELADRVVSGDLGDPILRQILPVADEDVATPGFGGDPVGDLPAASGGGLIHKYDGRALLITTAACGVHCRYCFRREFPYQEQSSRGVKYAPAIEAIAADDSITEVILSGGDPLTLDDNAIDELMNHLESISHVQRIRIHSRMPIVVPSRITDRLVDRLRCSRLTAWMVVHCNHAQEIDAEVAESFASLVDGGIPTLNQSVLLAGVNDDVDTLLHLSETLINHRVMPYYLHQLDRAAGVAHFEVPLSRGIDLIEQLRKRLPGYAVPTYVTDQPGRASKTVLEAAGLARELSRNNLPVFP